MRLAELRGVRAPWRRVGLEGVRLLTCGGSTTMVASKTPPVSVHVRLPDRVSEFLTSWFDVDVQALRSAAPWRTFRSCKGQRHYSGSFWSATENDLVLYESRLELARLLFADFDRAVHGIVAQPFLLETEIGGRRRRHVPDFLLLTDSVPTVVKKIRAGQDEFVARMAVEVPGADATVDDGLEGAEAPSAGVLRRDRSMARVWACLWVSGVAASPVRSSPGLVVPGPATQTCCRSSSRSDWERWM